MPREGSWQARPPLSQGEMDREKTGTTPQAAQQEELTLQLSA